MGATATGSTNDVLPLQPALGQIIQLGMLYDVRSQQFFSGISLWKDYDVNAVQAKDDTEYRYTYSLDEARNDNSLNVEVSLALDLKVFSAEGSAKYLNDKKSSKHEARLNVSCVIQRRIRRIPMEVLSKMTYEKNFETGPYTRSQADYGRAQNQNRLNTRERKCEGAIQGRKQEPHGKFQDLVQRRNS